MAIIKCKMCGGDITLAEDKTFGTCEYCGSTMTLPKVSDDQRAAAFNRGNHFRRMGEFDKALAVYERIVAEDDNDAEAHWCCALCRFGIEYVEDPATYEWLPTCHRASFDSFLEDVDYLAALEHSDGVTRRQYQKDAAKIAEVQRGILATSQNEKPFDVFICYKETDEDGNRTVDSTLAQDIYYQLTDKGYRVFFSRITLEDKAGAEYEPYIFAALNSAKVMIAVGTKAEYFNAVWVKNEWSRFLALMRKDRSKLLLPCYRDMDPYDLPEQLSVLQSYDMSKIGFIQDLIRGVAKVLDAEKEASAPIKETVVVQQSAAGGANLTAQLKRGQLALEDRDWKAADAFFDKALDMDAECAEAYWGKALAAAQCANGDELVQKRTAIVPDESEAETVTACEQDIARIEAAVHKYVVPGYLTEEEIRNVFSYDERSYASLTKAWQQRIQGEDGYWSSDRIMSRAARYAKGELAETIKDLQRRVTFTFQRMLSESITSDKNTALQIAQCYAAEMKRSEETAASKYESAIVSRQKYYEELCKKQANANTAAEFDRLAEMFENVNLSSFADCTERAEQCHESANRFRVEAASEFERRTKVSTAKRKKALFTTAIAFLVIIIVALLTVKVIIPSGQYKKAENLLAERKYEESYSAFVELQNYKDAPDRALGALYEKGMSLMADGEYISAISCFDFVEDYSDAKAMRTNAFRAYVADILENAIDVDAIAAELAQSNYADAVEVLRNSESNNTDRLEELYKYIYEQGRNYVISENYESGMSCFSSILFYNDSQSYYYYCKLSQITTSATGNYELPIFYKEVNQISDSQLRNSLMSSPQYQIIKNLNGTWVHKDTVTTKVIISDGAFEYFILTDAADDGWSSQGSGNIVYNDGRYYLGFSDWEISQVADFSFMMEDNAGGLRQYKKH